MNGILDLELSIDLIKWSWFWVDEYV